MNPRSILLAAGGALLGVHAANAVELVQNGRFASGNFADWVLFTTANGTTGNPSVVSYDVTGAGAQNAAKFDVGQNTFRTGQQGGGLYQYVATSAGLIDFSASLASYRSTGNLSGGVFEALLDDVVMATWDSGPTDGTIRRDTLTFATSTTAGSHKLEILITRPWLACDDGCTPNEYVTNVSLTQVGDVPELSTWAMMLLGFCGLGFFAYRRKVPGTIQSHPQ